MRVDLANIPSEKSIEDYSDDTEFVLNDSYHNEVMKSIPLTKDRIVINRSDYRVLDLFDYMNKNNINEENLTSEELEMFKVK